MSNKIYKTGIYARLSREDADRLESNSIQSQRAICLAYIEGHDDLELVDTYIDDGETGSNTDRPGFQRMIQDMRSGRIDCAVSKDLSRFSRNYIDAGNYLEKIFPAMGIRYIAINDNYDSMAPGSSTDVITLPFKNLVNDFYAKDTSKKVRSVMRAKGNSGKHLGSPPYGYRNDPEDKHHWLIDEEAAPVIRRIFDLTIDGKGPTKIARILEQEQVLTTKALYAKQKGKPLPDKPYRWNENSVVGILERIEYTGCTCNFKTYSKSYKLKKRIANDPENMAIFPNTQEAIITQAQFDRVQELRKNKRRPTKADRQGLFSGLLFCPDCGNKLHFATCKSFEGKQDHYVCSSYKSNRGTCTAHYIREETLRDLVLERIRAVCDYIRSDVDGFQEEWLQCRRTDQEKSILEDQRKIAKAKKRLADLDVLITRIYEDAVLGNLSQERYQKMSQSYEEEQERLKLEIEVTEEWVDQQMELEDNLDAFLALTEKYVDVRELTPTIVNEFIKKILVYAPDKSSGKRQQRVRIFFNFLDEVEIPTVFEPIIYERPTKNRKTA